MKGQRNAPKPEKPSLVISLKAIHVLPFLVYNTAHEPKVSTY